ncbi:hypothetical protein ACIQVO_23430 [Streptomyces sp. NPDC101062]|uniref:hypothetical protein n=1 Tax=unclassified Streptomyces TaxID=2593676 RepID=UPI002E7A52C2|nr:hypothetical protein [Streptomyces sp. JV176]MEE1804215.1 hypothetical protein [Streptomyces sp. JV176]
MKKLIRAAALLFLVGSIGYYLWNGLTRETEEGFAFLAWVGPQMIAPIVACTVVPFAFAFTGDSVMAAFSGRNSAAFRDGLIGVGTVTGTRPTGMSLNDQPELRIDLSVQGADGATFASYARLVVPMTDVALFQPGAMLPVRYLPGRTDKVEIDRSGDTVQAQHALNEAMVRQGVTTRENLQIAEHGVAAQAVVRSLEVPGELRGGNPRLVIGLGVTRPDGTSFTTEVVKYLPPRAVQHVQVGRVVNVHYLPDNESALVIAFPANA